MKYKDWSDFAVDCSGISEIMSRPSKATPMNKRERTEYEKLIAKEEPSEQDLAKIDKLLAKQRRYEDPDLSASAIKYLLRRYAWQKYNKKVASTGGFAHSASLKGNELESMAIQAVAELDNTVYAKCMESRTNGYVTGRCDIYHPASSKVIDVKAVWSVNTFLPYLNAPLDRRHWYQIQSYMELYGVEHGEVCYVLLNTPPHLVDREVARYTEKYVFGEIPRERYEEEMEKMDLAFNYDKIPKKRRVIRHVVTRSPDLMPKIYRRVERCRDWLNAFERLHLDNKPIIISPDLYSDAKEDNPETDSADPREGDQG